MSFRNPLPERYVCVRCAWKAGVQRRRGRYFACEVSSRKTGAASHRNQELVINQIACHIIPSRSGQSALAAWSSGMILTQGARGPGFRSWSSPCLMMTMPKSSRGAGPPCAAASCTPNIMAPVLPGISCLMALVTLVSCLGKTQDEDREIQTPNLLI